MCERRAYHFQAKNELIVHALEALTARGFKPVLSCYDNGHIKTKSKRGKTLSYYATTGTIAGYLGTNINGIEEYIRLLETI